MSPDFLLTSLVVVLLPGTGVIYTLATGLGRGFGASVAAAAGCTLGIVPAAAASIAGLAALFHASALAFLTVKYLGVAYLVFMAWQVLRDDGLLQVSGRRDGAGLARIAVTGALLNVLNPKLSLFFLAFLPQFVPPDAPSPLGALVTFAAVFMAMTFAVFVGYGAFASAARSHVIERPGAMRWIRRLLAGTFGVLGARLAVSE